MKDLTHYFQSPNKVVNTNNSSLEDVIEISPSPDLNSDHNGSVSLCFDGSGTNAITESTSLENSVCEQAGREAQDKEYSSAPRNRRKCHTASGSPSGYVNGISNCDGRNSKQLGEKPRKVSKKKCSENGYVISDEKCESGELEIPVNTSVSPNAFQVLMSTQQVFSSTNSGRKKSPHDIVENGHLKRDNKKKIQENLEQMAKRKLEMEANVKACEKNVGKSTKKRKRIIVESDPENEATYLTENSLDTDQAPEKKPGKKQKSGLKVEIKRKQKKNQVSGEISELDIVDSGVGESQELSVKNKNLKYQEVVLEIPKHVKKSKKMKVVNVCNELDISKSNNIGLQTSTSDDKVKADSEVINVSDNENYSNTDPVVISDDLSATPDATAKKGNILNYFNKVTSDMKQHPEKIKVTADIHFPVVSDVKMSRKVVMKKRSKKKDPNEDDIQLIDTEIIEKQNLPDSEVKVSSPAVLKTRLLCNTSPPVQTDSKSNSPACKNWKLRIQIKQSPSPANHKKCSSPVKKRKLKICDKQTRNSETQLDITLKETKEMLPLNSNLELEGKDKAAEEEKLQTVGEHSSSPSLRRKKTLAKPTPVKSKSCRGKEANVCEDKDTADKTDPLSRRMKDVLGEQCQKSENACVDGATLNEKCSAGGKESTPKGRRTFVAEKTLTPTLIREPSGNKGYLSKKCSKEDQTSPEPNSVKNTSKRKRSFLLQKSPPSKKSVAKTSPIKKTVTKKSPAKDNLIKDTSSNKNLGRDKDLEKEEFIECISIKKSDNSVKEESISSKNNTGKDSHIRGKKVLSLIKPEKNTSSVEKDETLAVGRAKRSCTAKNTTYTEEDIDSPKKSKGETTTKRKRSVSARAICEESNAFRSTGRRSSPRKKSSFVATDYGISDDEDDDFDDDSDDDFFGDSDYDSDFGDSDENFNKSDHQESVDSAFDVKRKKNDKEGKIASRRKFSSHKRKKYVSESLPMSEKELLAAFREKIAISKVKRAQSKGKMLNQEVVLQFINKAKGTLNRKMALHDPEHFSSNQTHDAEKKSEPIKLAPVFVSQKTKKPDKATMLARKTFLQSGVPEVVKKMVEVQKLAEELEHVEFPSISHIQQKDDDTSIWNLTDACQQFPPSLEVSLPTSLKVFKGDIIKCTEDSASTTAYSASHPPKILLFRDFLRCIKVESRDFPVYRTFKYLFEASHPQQLKGVKENIGRKGKRKSSLTKKEQAKSVQDSEKRCAAWTAKYQPLSSDNILGNGYNIGRFKKWLELWVQVQENTFQKNFKEDVSSGDEFLNNASDDESGRTVLPKKSVVLTGPTGSGKTMAVYALAHELGYKVLEVNAASKRTGRRILSELLEATQSHQVQGKGDEAVSGIMNFFTSKGIPEKTKRKKETEKISKLSLILVDDVDVVFEEEDEGFVSALSTLVIGSKRPVVLVSSDSSCPHLPRFMENSLVLEFRHPPSKMISVWMQLVALLEGVRVRKSCVEELLRYNKGDVRKTLLQLQFWVLSGGENSKALQESSNETTEDFPDDVSNSSWVSVDDKKTQNETNHPLHSQCLSSFLESDDQILSIDRAKIWWNVPKLAGLDQVSHHVKRNEKCDNECRKVAPLETASLESESTRKGDSEEPKKWKSVCSAEHMRVLVQLTDALSTVEELASAADGVASEAYQCAWEKAPLDSLSLSQDMRPSAYGTKLTAQSIGNWLVSASVNQSSSLLCPERQLPVASVIQQQPPQEEVSWREQQHNACREFEDAISMLYWPQRRAVTLDYMSCLRTISRLEHDRVSVNDKRNNRFFHYLRGLGAHPSPAALDTACNVFNIHNH